MQRVGVDEGADTVLLAFTVMVPEALIFPHPPVKGIEYEKVPETVGDPEIVIVLLAQLAVTPDGKPVAEPIPVAPVVV